MGISAKDMPKRQRFKTALAVALLVTGLQVRAAEIRGVVSVQQSDLFNDRGEELKAVPVSVALFPVEGQVLARHPSMEHTVVLSGSRLQPMYLAISRGDRVRFENRDDVYHELFTHSESQPLELRLDRSSRGGAATLTLTDIDDLHWFCHIHAKSYSRIDVLDTPLIHMVNAGDSFEFRDLAPGKWRIRVAAPGAETRIVEALAMTAPPPVQIQLAATGFNPGTGGATPVQAISVEQLFPSQPGL